MIMFLILYHFRVWMKEIAKNGKVKRMIELKIMMLECHI